jgi:SNF2 family DNA or RNA helicase
VEDLTDVTPVPCLRLYSAKLKRRLRHYGWVADDREEEEVSFAHLEFDYAGSRVAAQEAGDALEHFADGRLRRVRRKPRLEDKAERALSDAGFDYARQLQYEFDIRKLGRELTLADPEDWSDFVHSVLPRLRNQGWRIDIDDSFGIRFAEPEDWYGDAQADGGNDWFGIELGVLLDGQKVNLLPILLKVLETSPHKLNSETLTKLPDDAIVPVPLPDGRTLPFPASRARQMLGVLLELLDPNSLDNRGRLRLNKLRAVELAGEADWRWLGNAELTELSRRLRSFDGIQAVKPPPDLRATLRPYQQEGLNWLQFLREYELAGILADDMGLGKTVQALAHLLAEKGSGRADRPSLVVAPTSLMTNWRQETERFAPALRVLVLHGLDRKAQFERIPEHDLVITSYPLLPRDQAVLLQHQFHFLILDEAQFIKNPKTTYAQVACQLKARHHLCLTGTPMENHLGELWSLFHFLLPGFLGDEIRFNSIFRRPIEKGKNDERRKLLARRVAPFVLRRRKEEVVKELPPKTEIMQNVELAGAQRDLYESVRLAMHERVKAEVDRKGLSRAHIIILDALLKLRQICCHPQLLALPSAQKVKDSAKFELLMDLLPEMIEEGRRILLFSQFTSMLAIIESAVKSKAIPYVRLAGDTLDRATPVGRFQGGEVPLFLISLKAGGTGLNLTAADTVIHYDPWWNPAVENQATDRAHRIGQDKPVFVYKLMTVGTVEEKIVAMQARKRDLVEGLLNEERSENLKLTAEDLDVLFAPLQ